MSAPDSCVTKLGEKERLRLAVLLGISQVANATGFFWEAVLSRKRLRETARSLATEAYKSPYALGRDFNQRDAGSARGTMNQDISLELRRAFIWVRLSFPAPACSRRFGLGGGPLSRDYFIRVRLRSFPRFVSGAF